MKYPIHKRTPWLRLLAVLACYTLVPVSGAAEPQASEYAVKAAIIYKIAKFISWPQGAFGDGNSLPICLPKNDPMGAAMESLEGKHVQGRTIAIHHFVDSSSLSSHCAILYLSKTVASRRTALLSDVAYSPVLTIGDSADFVDIGGIITLQVQKSRVQFAINVGASSRAGLGISAQLLQLAKVEAQP